MADVFIALMRRLGEGASRGKSLLRLLSIILPLVSVLAVFTADSAYACPPSTTDGCPCVDEDIEPGLKSTIINSPVGGGFDIVNAILSTINGIMGQMAMTFYNNIILQPNYQNAVNSLVILYVTIYGILIMFSLASARTGEVVGRLIKIGIVWSIMGPGGWNFFSTYVGQPVLNSINDLITAFSNAGSGSPIQGSVDPNSGALSTSALESLFGPMTLVFSTTFAIMLIALMSTPVGWFMVFAIIWGLVEFFFMLIGAIITYVKAMVGLAFLFGLAPIFFTFILFDKTKQIFMGWVNQVLGFFLTPVLLFAFLGFYSVLLFNILHQILFSVDYCWVTFIKIGIFDVHWWRPINADNTCSNLCANGGDWAGGSPVMIVDTLYFLLLTHLGKNLSHFIEQIARDISGGSGPGVTRGDAVGRWFANNFAGGRGPGGIARDMFNAAGRQGKKLAAGAAARRQKIGEGMKKGAGAAAGAAGAGAIKAAKLGTRAILNPVGTAKDAKAAAGRARQAVTQGAKTAAGNVQQGMRTAIAAPGKGLSALGGAIGDSWQRTTVSIQQAGQDLADLGHQIKGMPASMKHGIEDKITGAQQAMADLGQRIHDTPGNLIGGAKTAAAHAIGEAATHAQQAASALGDAVGQIPHLHEHAAHAASKAVQGVGNAAGQAYKSARDWSES